MKITAKISFVVLFFGLFVNSLNSQTTSFNDAMKLAKESDKRVIIDFYTDWCGWCKKMDAEAYSNKDIKELIEDNFVFVKMNAEGTSKVKYRGVEYTESDLAVNFQVTGYPTTVFLEPDGKVIEFKYDKVSMNNVPGYFKTKDFKKILEYIKDSKYKDTDLSTIVN